MSTASSQTRIDNHLGQRFIDNNGDSLVNARTEGRSVDAPLKSHFAVTPPSQTSLGENKPKQLIGQSLGPAEVISPQLEPSVPRHVEGVVSEIKRDTVTLKFFSPNGDIEMQLPPTLISSALMRVGRPVTISLDTTGGYRRPVIRARAIGSQPKLPGQDEFEKWAETL